MTTTRTIRPARCPAPARGRPGHWQAARDELLVREKAHTPRGDASRPAQSAGCRWWSSTTSSRRRRARPIGPRRAATRHRAVWAFSRPEARHGRPARWPGRPRAGGRAARWSDRPAWSSCCPPVSRAGSIVRRPRRSPEQKARRDELVAAGAPLGRAARTTSGDKFQTRSQTLQRGSRFSTKAGGPRLVRVPRARPGAAPHPAGVGQPQLQRCPERLVDSGDWKIGRTVVAVTAAASENRPCRQPSPRCGCRALASLMSTVDDKSHRYYQTPPSCDTFQG